LDEERVVRGQVSGDKTGARGIAINPYGGIVDSRSAVGVR
jgi:hypothetical protein